MNEQIVFRKARHFSEILSDTFTFTRQNIKIVSLYLLVTMGWAVVLVSIYMTYFLPRYSEVREGGFDIMRFIVPFIPAYFILLLMVLLYSCLIYAYIVLYMDRGYDQFEMRDLLSLVGQNYYKTLVAAIISTVFILVGLTVFILPAIYLIVPLSFMLIVIFREELGVFEAIPRCFRIVSGNWWNTFGLLLLLGVIAVLLQFLVSLPQMAVTMFIERNAVQGTAAGGYRLLSATMSIFTHFLYFTIWTIVYVGIAFQYFSLVEQKGVTGLLKRIDAIEKAERVDWDAAGDEPRDQK